MNRDYVSIFGGTGIVGKSISHQLRLRGFRVRIYGRANFHLPFKSPTPESYTISDPSRNPIVIFAAGEFPVRNEETLTRNVTLAETFCKSFSRLENHRVIYVSSDAVYLPSATKILESSSLDNEGFHAKCHLLRENIFRDRVPEENLLIIRPVALFGPNDSHGSYGPNAFAKAVNEKRSIEIWGRGSELRDHLYEKDFAKLVISLIIKKAQGVFNISSGKQISFLELALLLRALSANEKEIIFRNRQANVVNEESRLISNEKLLLTVGEFSPTPFQESLKSFFR